MRDNLSPEEKLLRLIRGEKKQGVAADKKIDFENLSVKPISKKPLSLPITRYLAYLNIRKFIVGFLILSVAYLIISIIYPFVGLKKIKLPLISSQTIKEPLLLQKEEIRPYEFYLEGVRQRQIFGSLSVPEIGGSAVTSQATSIKDISLVGIVSGEHPQAIIEDKNTQKTYYVTRGQFIGEFQLEDIQEGKIILNSKGQRYELNI